MEIEPQAMEPLGDEADSFAKTIERMQRAWINESNAPEILPYNEQLVQRLMRKIEDQVCNSLFGRACSLAYRRV